MWAFIATVTFTLRSPMELFLIADLSFASIDITATHGWQHGRSEELLHGIWFCLWDGSLWDRRWGDSYVSAESVICFLSSCEWKRRQVKVLISVMLLFQVIQTVWPMFIRDTQDLCMKSNGIHMQKMCSFLAVGTGLSNSGMLPSPSLFWRLMPQCVWVWSLLIFFLICWYPLAINHYPTPVHRK